jgi:hypothetical protein
MGNKQGSLKGVNGNNLSNKAHRNDSMPSISSARREELGWAPAPSRMAMNGEFSGPAGRLRNPKDNKPTSKNPLFGGPNDKSQRDEETPFTHAVPFATSKEVKHERDRRALSTYRVWVCLFVACFR